ncbi:telomere length regulation protein-domain-containing protein [Lasiosphaeria hispida]|uniref:Telomere length regulation protein-domain-containing protein n=1 Tax=Lasiosphaeria hispida TaxID=260671 RepID=A0AAJ0MJ35_9PEZI|nr:telomere length regulation protein-domain-containing protein [Lasiosphaeria hispida]
MDGLLTPVSVIRTEGRKTGFNPIQELDTGTSEKTRPKSQPSLPLSPEDALHLLRNEPGYDPLVATLKFLARDQPQDPAAFNIRRPGPLSAQLVQVLVSEIVPSYWALLKEDTNGRKTSGLSLLLSCLRSIAGVNAVLARLKASTQETKSEPAGKGKRPDLSINIGALLDLLCELLAGDSCIMDAWGLASAGQDSRPRLRSLSQELLAIFGSGRIVSITAEADIISAKENTKRATVDTWPADGLKYTKWLARNIVRGQLSDPAEEQTKLFSDLFVKALRLGHPDTLVKDVMSKILLSEGADSQRFGLLLDSMPQMDQRKVLFSVLKVFSDEYLNRLGLCESEQSKTTIAASAGAIQSLVRTSETRRNHLVEWLASSSGAGLGEGIGIRRAVLAVVSQDKDSVINVLEKSINQLGDQLYIKHSPILQQEAHVQVLLLSAGYVSRISLIKLTILLRTSIWLNAISNRLAASHQRARFLGMVVGEALSGLVNKDDKKLDFHMEETKLGEGRWYKELVEVFDRVGPMNPLLKPQVSTPALKKTASAAPAKRPSAARPPQQGFIIEELSGEEADVVPYVKPDSDSEDSDDDATLVRRDKPKAPVYVRDLIRYLRDTESYDHQKLALTTAPTLTRRKANYGTEVAEHAEELASLLVGLQDKFEIDNFDDLKLQGMIAIVVARPETMGSWFSKTFFDGDYSVSQRASVLIVLGLSARELAGLETSEYAAAASFPSKALPERVERLYTGSGPRNNELASGSSLKPLPPNALDNMARSITSDILTPMAASAADAATGPDVLKLSTFTSRLEGAQQQSGSSNPKIKTKARPRPRVRAIPNTTAQLLSTAFFSPLTARFQAALHSPASRIRGIVFQPHLLALYLKTLALVLHAAGPSTLALPQMTAELWGLLLGTGVRAHAVGDLGVTQAVLFALLALLDVNGDRMRDVCQDMGKEVVETQEWVAGAFAGLRGGDGGGEEEQVKMLAAGVLVRLREGVEKYRLLMVGDLIGYG